MADRPIVEINPAVRFGAPRVRHVRCVDLAGMYAAGEDPDVVCEEYDVNRHELLTALWFEATHGSDGRRRRAWKQWADDIFATLGGHQPLDVDAVVWPPVRPSRGVCPVCKQEVGLRADGMLKVHYPSCPGSGKPPSAPERRDTPND